MSDATVAKSKYDRALARMEKLEQQSRQSAETMVRLQKNPDISEEARRRQISDLREQTFANYRDARDEIETLLGEADKLAFAALAGDPTDAALEARKARAAMRVGRLLDKGTPLVNVAEVFAAAGDLDALRALRDEIPSVVASVDNGDRLGERVRGQQIRQLTISIDNAMAPLLPEPEAQAARLRNNIDVAQQIVTSMGESLVRNLDRGYVDNMAVEFGKSQLVEV